ncbi:MAG: helix-turn-helix domain-containing protein [Synergistaceae bacterium]|jgi:hypothetical protein|nr:helix-turn-helix domain-containing protein [Synergistaceae bacterium]
MGAIKEGYVTATEAAAIIGKKIRMIAVLCQSGRLPGAEKIGNTWLIPRASVESYSPGKRGPRTKKEKLSAEMENIRTEMEKSAKE